VLREKIGALIGPAKDLREAAAACATRRTSSSQDSFLVEHPILQAIRATEPPVLLLDEIDRADEEFEAFLLEFLSDYQVSIPEIGTIRAVHPPLVVLTSNRSRELSEATKRRCLHLQLDYPEAEMELEIVRLKAPGIGEALAGELAAQIQRIRGLDLRKAPSIGETLDWAQALVVLGAPSLSRELIEETLSVVVKYDGDAAKVRRALAVDAGEAEPGGHTHSHSHTHSHGHSHSH
jgi:MoxR-like ATPase